MGFTTIPGSMDVLGVDAAVHGQCRGCAATLTERLTGVLPGREIRELLEALGLVDGGRSRVRRLVDSGMSNAEIVRAVPGATVNDCDRARAQSRGSWSRDAGPLAIGHGH